MIRLTHLYMVIVIFSFLVAGVTGCGQKEPSEMKGTVTLAVTEELNKTGLFIDLFPVFTYETGWQVKIIVVDTTLIEDRIKEGEFDALLLNDPLIDQTLADQGYATPRLDVLSFQNEVKGMSSTCTVDFDAEYGITALNTSLHTTINETGATELRDWMVGQVAQAMIGTYRIKERRGQLFLSAEEGTYG